MYVISGFNGRRSAQNYFNAIQTPNTYENRNFVYSNRRIFTIIFPAQNRQTNKNIPPLPENNGTLKYKECIHVFSYGASSERGLGRFFRENKGVGKERLFNG